MAKIIIEVEDLDPQVVTFRVRQDAPPKTPAEQSNAERIANLLTFQAAKAVKDTNPVYH
jgi:hypothetical protein